MEKELVIGAGLVGSLQAVLLAKKGFHVDVYDRRPDIRKMDFIGGRSINLALSDRGWKALELAGVDKEIRDISIPMYGRKMHALDGEVTFQSYGKENEAIYSVSRGELNRQLLLKADTYDNVNLHFDSRCIDVDLETQEVAFQNSNSGEIDIIKGNRVYGTDGAFSAVRSRMQKTDRFNYSQIYMTHGYKELIIPANEDGSHKLDKNALHIWPRGQFMLIALANLDGSFTVTLFFPFEGETSFESLDSDEKIMTFFKETFPDAVPLMPTLIKDYHENPTSSLCIIRCEPWTWQNKVMLMGDAAHAIVPFYGQGMNAGFEDCSEWWRLAEKHDNNWSAVFNEFAEIRKPNGDAIAELALTNYIEMRDLVGDEMFLLRKKIENRIYDKYPDKWVPLYSMVTFTHTPYADALDIGKKQRKIMDEVMSRSDIKDTWDSEEVEREILSRL
ncbi:MAG: kynurenine 3-monooxygenase [Crocinitomicaceae bacterium]|mgnify:CR=1 FL=1|nr:kynurenine 3-monooxygenase [Crocinitomicaceae bacterium]|tara:strand:+ start:10579 stop:11913 length:1335 start_codon:yes stop_codon:yes gene_type:complete